MKPFTPLHPLGCDCTRCAPPMPADRARLRARAWRRILFGLALFWAFPGRWLLAGLWAALSHLLWR